MADEPFLDLNQLQQEKRIPDKINKKVNTMLLAKCHEKIKKYNKLYTNNCCIFEIPQYMLGYPGYNLITVNRFIVASLTNNGLFAQTIADNKIYISWKPEDLDMRQYNIKASKLVKTIENPYKISPMADGAGIEASSRGKHAKKSASDPDDDVILVQWNDWDTMPVNRKNFYSPPKAINNDDARSRVPIRGQPYNKPSSYMDKF